MKNIIITFVIIMMLTACSNEEVTNYKYTFIGEGEYWKAEYLYKGTEVWDDVGGKNKYSNKYNDEFILIYKGATKDIKSLDKLEYSYKTNSRTVSGTSGLDESQNNITYSTRGGGTGARVREEENIQVDVKWYDFEESFELTIQD